MTKFPQDLESQKAPEKYQHWTYLKWIVKLTGEFQKFSKFVEGTNIITVFFVSQPYARKRSQKAMNFPVDECKSSKM